MASRNHATTDAATPSALPPPETLPDDVRFAASDGLVWRRADARPGPAWQPVERQVAINLLSAFRADPGAWSQSRADQIQRALEDIGAIEQPMEHAA